MSILSFPDLLSPIFEVKNLISYEIRYLDIFHEEVSI